MVVINVIATRLQVDGSEHVNHKSREEKQVALHFDGTELRIVYDGCKSSQRPLKWKYNKIKMIPSGTTYGCDTLQSDGLTLMYRVQRSDKRMEIQSLLKAPTSSSSSSSGKTKENVNRQTPSTGSTSSSQHQPRKANMTPKPKIVLQSQPISVTKSASVSRGGYSSSSSSSGIGTYLHHRSPSPLLDREQQEGGESDYERAIAGDLLHQPSRT